uniref:Uncharacterized protein n=1 Tax=Steinernema glaseri TaxID=37863 RepID=A0A1I7YJ81_9BILA
MWDLKDERWRFCKRAKYLLLAINCANLIESVDGGRHTNTERRNGKARTANGHYGSAVVLSEFWRSIVMIVLNDDERRDGRKEESLPLI